MAFGHAAAEFVDQLACGDTRRGELDPRLAHPPRDRESAQSLSPVATLTGEPVRPLLDDVANPPQGLDIVDQGRSAEQPDLRRKRWLVPRHAALAFDAFEHRRFLAADIGASAASQVNAGMPHEAGCLDRGDLAFENVTALRIFVA